eukprot:scaffold248223_cov38-Prasinocladus_malaysianus.AAC.2
MSKGKKKVPLGVGCQAGKGGPLRCAGHWSLLHHPLPTSEQDVSPQKSTTTLLRGHSTPGYWCCYWQGVPRSQLRQLFQSASSNPRKRYNLVLKAVVGYNSSLNEP